MKLNNHKHVYKANKIEYKPFTIVFKFTKMLHKKFETTNMNVFVCLPTPHTHIHKAMLFATKRNFCCIVACQKPNIASRGRKQYNYRTNVMSLLI